MATLFHVFVAVQIYMNPVSQAICPVVPVSLAEDGVCVVVSKRVPALKDVRPEGVTVHEVAFGFPEASPWRSAPSDGGSALGKAIVRVDPAVPLTPIDADPVTPLKCIIPVNDPAVPNVKDCGIVTCTVPELPECKKARVIFGFVPEPITS